MIAPIAPSPAAANATPPNKRLVLFFIAFLTRLIQPGYKITFFDSTLAHLSNECSARK